MHEYCVIITTYLDVTSVDFQVAVTKSLLLRDKWDHVFNVNGSAFALEEALRNEELLSFFHLETSRTWDIPSMKNHLQQEHPEMLLPSPKSIVGTATAF